MKHWKSNCGQASLILGDCLEVLPSIQRKFDLVFTSPPYNCGKEYGEHDDNQEQSKYWDWLERFASTMSQSLRVGGVACINHGVWMGSRTERIEVADELIPLFSRYIPKRDTIIWNKGQATAGSAWGNYSNSPRIRAQHEHVFVFGGFGNTEKSDIDWSDWASFTTSIWNIPPPKQPTSHPAVMPVEVAHRCIMLYSPKKGGVCDPFCGTGTTGVAAIRNGRHFLGIETNKRYFDIARDRIQDAIDDLDGGPLFAAKKRGLV